MFGRKIAIQSKELLEYLAKTQFDQRKRLSDQLAVVDEKNAALESTKSKLERLLQDALALDSYIDLDSLKTSPRIPDFAGRRPRRHSYLPIPLSGFESLFPWKRRAYRDQYEAAETKYKEDHHDYREALNEHQKQVDQEQAEVEAHNEEVELYKQDFAAKKPKAVGNYFELILKNSAYPPNFSQKSIIVYSAKAAELRIDFALPTIDVIPETKSYQYHKDIDEIARTDLPQKQRRQLYSLVLAQISLRTIYEIFEADRTKIVDSIVFDGYVEGINPSTGQPGRFCLVALNITRQQFDSLDLRRVEPLSCLKGLNARLSSKPDQLLAVSPMTQESLQDATVADTADILYSRQRLRELESEILTQGNQITELESRLATRRDKNGELASMLRNKQAVIAELENRLEAQRDRIAELIPELRDQQERNAELQVEIQGQKDYIAKLENRIEPGNDDIVAHESTSAEAPDDTQLAAALAEITDGSELSEAEIFTPIASETPGDDYGGARIPPREPEGQANMHLAPHPKLLEIMSIIVQACQHGRFIDYKQAALSEYQVDRLLQEGMLECSALNSYKLRPSPAGVEWYYKHSQRQKPPKQVPEADSIPPREPEAQANRDVAQKPNLLEIMSIFAEAKGGYVDYIGEGLPKEQINRLVREGKLERHRFSNHILRATPAGYIWYRKRSEQGASPTQETKGNLPDATQAVEAPVTLGDLLQGKTNPRANSDEAPTASPDDLLGFHELVTIAADLDGDEAKLLALMMRHNWECSEARIQSAFPGQFISAIIHNINDRAFEAIEDNLIEEEGGWLTVGEEYRDALEQALKLADNQYLNSERGRQ